VVRVFEYEYDMFLSCLLLGDTLIQFKCFSKLNQFFLDSLHFVGGHFVDFTGGA
jgi:hypothetical protein